MATATREQSRTPARTRKKAKQISCDDCFFKRNDLCALGAEEPCTTFRHHEQGLTPPKQLSFVFRQERTQAAWTFKDAA